MEYPCCLIDPYYDLYMTDFLSLAELEASFSSSPSKEDMEFWHELMKGVYYEKSRAY